jgi:hypothetical protein
MRTKVYIMPTRAINARKPINLTPSCENLKSTGFGNSIDLTSSPLAVENPVKDKK